METQVWFLHSEGSKRIRCLSRTQITEANLTRIGTLQGLLS